MVETNTRLTVSVVIPSFNAAKYLPEALDGILAQSFKPLEIIVVDDGSTDNTREVLRPFIETGKVKYFFQENQGPGAARNLGVLKARGDLVAFCDSDDLWLPDKLEKQVKLFQNPETALVYSDMEILGGANANYLAFAPVPAEQEIDVTQPVASSIGGAKYSVVNKIKKFYRGNVFNQLVKGNFIPNSTVVARRRVVEDSGGFPRGRKFFSVEDYVCWLVIAKEHKVDFVDEPLVKYRWHDENISQQSDKLAYQRLADVYAYLIGKYGPLPIVFWKYFEYKVKVLLS